MEDAGSQASLQELVELAAEICEAPLAFVSIVEAEREVFVAAVGSDAADSPRDISFCGHAIVETEEVFVVPDTHGDHRFAENPNVLGGPQIRFYAGARLLTRDGHALGALCVKDTVPRELSSAQLGALAVLGRQVVAQLDLRRQLTAERDAARVLRRDRLLYQTLVERSPDLIALIELDGTIRFVSAAHEQLLGYTSSELLGAPAGLIADTTELEHAFTMVNAVLTGEEPLLLPMRLRRKNGDTLQAESRLTLIQDDPLEPPLVLFVSRDLTERVRLEEQYVQAERMETMGQLTSAVAHDFNNLLSPMIVYSELALMQLQGEDAKVLDEIEQIKTAAEQGRVLIARLLDVANPQMLAARPLSLDESVTSALPLLRVLLGGSVTVVVEQTAGLPLCNADPGGLNQVLLNLAANARDVLPKSGAAVTIGTGVRTLDAGGASALELNPGPHVTLRFTDNGCGMDEETQKRIFDPFFTTKGDRGTGLGLTTVLRVVARLEGAIEVESAPGAGSTFTIILPAIPAGTS